VAEVLVYNRSLSDAEISTAEEYLTGKYSSYRLEPLPRQQEGRQCATTPHVHAAEAVGGALDLEALQAETGAAEHSGEVFLSFEPDPSPERQRETPEQVNC
jgi:hypothetical protein